MVPFAVLLNNDTKIRESDASTCKADLTKGKITFTFSI